MPFDEESKETQPLHRSDTVPEIPEWAPAPQPVRGFGRFREYLGTAGLVVVVVLILSGVVLASSLIPAVRHGVGRIVRHQETVKSPLSRSPSLRDGSTMPPRSFRGGAVSVRPYTPRPGKPRVVPSRTVSPAATRTRPAVQPSPVHTSVNPAPPTATETQPAPSPTPTQPEPTPTPTPTPTTPTPTTAAPTVSITVPTVVPDVVPVPSVS